MVSKSAKAIFVTTCIVAYAQGALAQSPPTCPSQNSLTRKIERQNQRVEKARDGVEKYDASTANRQLSYETRAANYQAKRQTYIENYQENCYLGGFLGGQDIGQCISKNKSLADRMKYQRDRVLALMASFLTKRASGRIPKVAKVDRELAKQDALVQLFNTCYPVGGP
ncbi:MAG: hypothetical protein RL417_134 [Pseudomonadota bacterium]|jgi:hypothetical protein